MYAECNDECKMNDDTMVKSMSSDSNESKPDSTIYKYEKDLNNAFKLYIETEFKKINLHKLFNRLTNAQYINISKLQYAIEIYIYRCTIFDIKYDKLLAYSMNLHKFADSDQLIKVNRLHMLSMLQHMYSIKFIKPEACADYLNMYS